MAIVGKILLGILLFILILLLLILFLPICYRVKGKIDAEGKSINAKVSWFFGLIRFRFDYPEPARPILKLAFFTLMGKEEKESGEKPEASGKKGKPGKETEESKEALAEVGKSEEAKDELERSENHQTEASVEVNEPEDDNNESDLQEEKKKSKKPPKVKESKEEKESEKAGKKEKIQKILDDVKFYKALWEEKDTQPFVKDALARVLHVLKNLLPKKIRGRLLFGAASPDVTGYAYGVYCVLKTMYPKRFSLEVTPDFERKVLEADVLIKGRFMVITLLIDALRIFFDKRFRTLRQKIDLRKHPEKAQELKKSRKGKKRKRRRKMNRNKES
ncbi:MAG: DUF2953 domain-containing protein [Acetatifactor sp.]|nr:DUF2953 domain-containing protein [Acetatifactor sp.]